MNKCGVCGAELPNHPFFIGKSALLKQIAERQGNIETLIKEGENYGTRQEVESKESGTPDGEEASAERGSKSVMGIPCRNVQE